MGAAAGPALSGPTLRQRVLSGAKAQVFENLVRVVVQLGGVTVLLPVWGLHRYGEWLVLSAVPTYLSFSDLGFFAAARYDMIMAVARGDRAAAVDVFRAVSRGVGAVLLVLAVALPLLGWLLPLGDWLNLGGLSEGTTGTAIVALGFDTLLLSYAGLLYGGFACVGYYGEGAIGMSAINLAEFAGVVIAVIATKNPAVAAGAMLGARLLGTAAMYAAMRRRAPWLVFGRPVGHPEVLRRLTKPALASAAFPVGLALNVQGTVVLLGVVAGPAAAAVFSTVRTVSRIVIQLLGSVSFVIAPEVSKAYAERDDALLRRLHRNGCRTAVWLALPLVAFLAGFGGPLIRVATSGTVHTGGVLLYLFLAATAVDTLWYTSLAVLFSTNRHPRVALIYVVACGLSLPITWALLELWGLEGAALVLLGLEVFMLVVALRASLPAAHDRLGPWLRALVQPPRPGLLRAQLRGG